MSFFYLIIIGFFVALFIAITVMCVKDAEDKKLIKQIKEVNYIENARQSLISNGFNVDRFEYLDKMIGINNVSVYAIFFDNKNKQIAFVNAITKTCYVTNYDKLISYEVLSNKKLEVSGNFTEALAGGLLFGPTGAIIGASTGREIEDRITDLQFIIKINDFNFSFIKLDLIEYNLGFKTADKDVKKIFNQINSILATFEYIKHNQNKE